MYFWERVKPLWEGLSGVINANALLLSSTVQAFANADTLRSALLYTTFAKGALTGLTATVLYVDSPTPTGAGTISKYTALQIIEQTHGTANIGLLIGANPGGSTNYAVYANSANASYFGGAVYVGGQKLSAKAHVLAADGTAQVADADDVTRLLILVDVSNGASAIYIIEGGNHVTAESSDPAVGFSPTAGTGNQINVYWSGSRYEIQNKFAVSHTVYAFCFGG